MIFSWLECEPSFASTWVTRTSPGAGDAAHGGTVREGVAAAHVPFAEHTAGGLPRGEQTGDGCASTVQDASVGVDAEARRGEAESGGSDLGASPTTMHHMFEEELAHHLGVPEDVAIVALLPIGFPQGRFGPVTRKPAEELTHFDRWGRRASGPVLLGEAAVCSGATCTRARRPEETKHVRRGFVEIFNNTPSA